MTGAPNFSCLPTDATGVSYLHSWVEAPARHVIDMVPLAPMLPFIRHPSAGLGPGAPSVASAGAATLAGADGGGGGCGGRASLESPGLAM